MKEILKELKKIQAILNREKTGTCEIIIGSNIINIKLHGAKKAEKGNYK